MDWGMRAADAVPLPLDDLSRRSDLLRRRHLRRIEGTTVHQRNLRQFCTDRDESSRSCALSIASYQFGPFQMARELRHLMSRLRRLRHDRTLSRTRCSVELCCPPSLSHAFVHPLRPPVPSTATCSHDGSPQYCLAPVGTSERPAARAATCLALSGLQSQQHPQRPESHALRHRRCPRIWWTRCRYHARRSPVRREWQEHGTCSGLGDRVLRQIAGRLQAVSIRQRTRIRVSCSDAQPARAAVRDQNRSRGDDIAVR